MKTTDGEISVSATSALNSEPAVTAEAKGDSRPAQRARRWRRARWFALVVLFSLTIWIVIDLYAPVKNDIRRFDPDEVARLDTAMWRSYYSRQRVRLFLQLSELLRTQYGLPFWRSNLVSFYAARAAFVFKDGKSRADYERALPSLERFFAEIRDASSVPFDAPSVARLELEWWIAHRERERRQPGELEAALADTAAVMYNLPAERMREHARLRAEAMAIRDRRAAEGGVTAEDWQRIEALLLESWRSLHGAVNPPAGS